LETNSKIIQSNVQLVHVNTVLTKDKKSIEKENLKLKLEIENLKGRNAELTRIIEDFFTKDMQKLTIHEIAPEITQNEPIMLPEDEILF
jgi:hypothetical protein